MHAPYLVVLEMLEGDLVKPFELLLGIASQSSKSVRPVQPGSPSAPTATNGRLSIPNSVMCRIHRNNMLSQLKDPR